MGLFVENDHPRDVAIASNVLMAVGAYWNLHLSPWGYSFECGKKSISRISHLASKIFETEGFSTPPGPFKRAAAFSILCHLFLDVSFLPKQGNVHLGPKEINIWRSRIAFLLIAPTIRNLYIKDGLTEIQLKKAWKASTLHLRLDMLNWLRWLEKPYDYNNLKALDIGRLKRMVMVYSLVIEQSYYMTNNALKCEIMNNSSCLKGALEDETSSVDVWFMAEGGQVKR